MLELERGGAKMAAGLRRLVKGHAWAQVPFERGFLGSGFSVGKAVGSNVVY